MGGKKGGIEGKGVEKKKHAVWKKKHAVWKKKSAILATRCKGEKRENFFFPCFFYKKY